MQCPNCGHAIEPTAKPSLRLTPAIVLQLILWLYGIASWLVALVTMTRFANRGRPIYDQQPVTGLLANPAVQVLLFIGIVVGLVMVWVEWSQTTKKRYNTQQCQACGHKLA
jgi:multisubunit Na+/H+ antiporter MnhC subunit